MAEVSEVTKFTQSVWEQIRTTQTRGGESEANAASVNAVVFERHGNKAQFYLARGNTQKAAALRRGGF